jgi:4-amino-4-deoxy-L-arabinose transferase-like glycosyltransferase
VTQTSDSQINGRTPSGFSSLAAVRFLWIILILATLYLCYFHNLGVLGLLGPDEPRYAWIARDMAKSGDMVTPRLYGEPWFEKPVLYYWAAAKTFNHFGVSEASARFPSAFSALLATLAMAWLAWKLYGAETARWLLLLLPTTVGMIGFSRAAATDMLFSGTLTIAMVFATVLLGIVPLASLSTHVQTGRFYRSHRPGALISLLLFGFFLGLAVLSKGPAALILAGSAVLLWATITARWHNAFRCLHPVAVASFCATALPWYILCSRRNPDFLRVFIIEHNFKRFLTPEFQHIQPLWYYIPILLLAVFPWTILLISGIMKAIRTSRESLSTNGSVLFFLCWALFTVFFFTISKSKLPGYILPALPAIMILIAHYVVQLLRENNSTTRWIFLFTGFTFVLLGLGLQHYAGMVPAIQCVSPLCGIRRIWMIALLGGMVIGALGFARKPQLSLLLSVLATLFLVIEINRFLPYLDLGISARDATRVVKTIWPDFSPERSAAWQLNRSFVYQLSFYLQTQVPEWQSDTAKPDWLFVKSQMRQEAVQQGFKCATFAPYPAVIPCRNRASLNRLGSLDGNGSSGIH